MNKKLLASLLPLTLASAALAAPAPGYWHDASGAIVRNTPGECWRAGYWTPELAIAECDPALVKKPEPVKVVAAPVPKPVEPPKVVEPPKPAPTPVAQPALPPMVAPAPAAIAVAPPAPAPKPVKAPPRRIALESSASFTVGKAELSAVGREGIDRDVINRLSEFATVEGIAIVGHTDPLGSEARNRKLSKDRAEAVKAYMVSKGVNANLIKTDGVGSSQPAPSIKCDPKLARAKLAECLAPHRRIEVDVAGEAK